MKIHIPVPPVFLSVVLLFFSATTFGQANNIRRLVDTLASPAMEGRGYVNNGLNKAANFIEQEFLSLGLVPVGKSFRQGFYHDVVVFEGATELEVDGKKLRAGIDYVVTPGSTGVKGKARLQQLDSSRWIDPNLRVVIEIVDKLTWSVATVQDDYTGFQVLHSSLSQPLTHYQANLDAKLVKNFKSENLVGMVKGAQRPDSFLVITAHYDHLGKLGKEAMFRGANDNASGVALMLDLAARVAKAPLKYSVAFIAFAGEEAGLLGSGHFVKEPMVPLDKIRFLVNVDIAGTGDEGVMVVNATQHAPEYKLLINLNSANGWLPQVGQRGPARNSDHYYFDKVGVPAFFLYTMGGIKAYHDIFDLPQTLPLTKTGELGKLILGFFQGLCSNEN